MIEFTDVLAGAQRSAVHLEMRDSYMLDDPEFLAWKAGDRRDPADRASWWRPWLDLMQRTVERGVEVRRARIVSEPISDYIRFEYDGAFTNVAAGEKLRWLPRRRATDLPLPGNDFWLFDERLVLVNHFTGDGQWADPDMELIEDADVVKLCGTAFEMVWERAIPHEDYHP